MARGFSDVAVFPCAPARPGDTQLADLGEEIGWRVALNLEDVPGISVAGRQAAISLFHRRDGELDPSDWTDRLRAQHALRCVVDAVEGGLDVEVRLLDDGGDVIALESLPVRTDEAGDRLRRASVAVSMYVIGELAPGVNVTAEEVDRLAAYRIEAIRPFFWGDHALRRGAWLSAEQRYLDALAADSTFTLARLRLAEVRRWLVDRPIDEDLAAIRRMDLSSLSPLDSLLLEAGATPHGPDQLAAYEAILAMPEHRLDPYATLLYADELYHRGGLWGVHLDSAIHMLGLAVARDSSLVPAVEHLTQALIRTGREAEAAAILEHLGTIHAAEHESYVFYPEVWGLGFQEKFHPDEAVQAREGLGGLSLEELSLYARWVRYIDSPATQIALGELLVAAADRAGDSRYAAQGFVDRGLGLITLGRIAEGLASFDSAAHRFETEETVAQAAEWKVIPHALGATGFTEADSKTGARALQALWHRLDAGGNLRVRVATALALRAAADGDSAAAVEWTERLTSMASASVPGAGRSRRLMSGISSASRGRYRDALAGTAADLAYDSAGLADHPFLRSALYLKRGDWYVGLGMRDSAVASWLWHENTDLEGTVPPHLVQAGEVDGALGPYARARTEYLKAEDSR
jgi:hypothetical protein